MATTESPIVVGIFRDRSLAEPAIDELRHAGCRADQVRLAGQTAAAGGLLDHLDTQGPESRPTKPVGVSGHLVALVEAADRPKRSAANEPGAGCEPRDGRSGRPTRPGLHRSSPARS